MSHSKHQETTGTAKLLERIERGDHASVNSLLERHRDYLKHFLEARMEVPLRRRVDPSDVIQETFLVANQRLADFIERRPTTFRLWLRRKAFERLVELRRKHFAKKRAVGRDVQLESALIVRSFSRERPSRRLQRRETSEQIQQVLEQLADSDREMLLLRHVEGLTNAEIANLLDIEPKTASKRYGRALRRFSTELANKGISL